MRDSQGRAERMRIKEICEFGVKQEEGFRGHKYVKNETDTTKGLQPRFTTLIKLKNKKNQNKKFH